MVDLIKRLRSYLPLGNGALWSQPSRDYREAADLIESQAAEITRIDGEYQEACRLIAQMHLSAVGGVVGPKQRKMTCDCNKIDEECDYREGCKVNAKIKKIKSSELKPIEEITAPYREQIKQLTEERDALKSALEKLACLGNGDSYGNSMGNCIAQEALANVKGVTK